MTSSLQLFLSIWVCFFFLFNFLSEGVCEPVVYDLSGPVGGALGASVVSLLASSPARCSRTLPGSSSGSASRYRSCNSGNAMSAAREAVCLCSAGERGCFLTAASRCARILSVSVQAETPELLPFPAKMGKREADVAWGCAAISQTHAPSHAMRKCDQGSPRSPLITKNWISMSLG